MAFDRDRDYCPFVPTFDARVADIKGDIAVNVGVKPAFVSIAGRDFNSVAAERVVFLCEDVGVSDWVFVREESGDVDDPHACRQSQEADQGGEDFPAFLHRFCFLCVGGETGIRSGGLVIGSARGLFL